MKSNKYGDRIPLDISVRQNTYFCLFGKNQFTRIASAFLELNPHCHSYHIMPTNFTYYSENRIATNFRLYHRLKHVTIKVQSQEKL